MTIDKSAQLFQLVYRRAILPVPARPGVAQIMPAEIINSRPL